MFRNRSSVSPAMLGQLNPVAHVLQPAVRDHICELRRSIYYEVTHTFMRSRIPLLFYH